MSRSEVEEAWALFHDLAPVSPARCTIDVAVGVLDQVCMVFDVERYMMFDELDAQLAREHASSEVAALDAVAAFEFLRFNDRRVARLLVLRDWLDEPF